MIPSRSRSPKRRHYDETSSSLLFLFWTRQSASTREGQAAKQEWMNGIFSALYWCSCMSIFLSSVLFQNSDGVAALSPLKHCTLLPTTLDIGKINN